ncbi:MAG: hypothetical protein AB8F74_01100 [Saprospiraceae bacterium]
MIGKNKNNYKKETSASIGWKGMTEQGSANEKELKLSKNHVLFGSWLLFLGAWISWSLNHDNYLLQEALPALMIVNFLLMVKAMGEK